MEDQAEVKGPTLEDIISHYTSIFEQLLETKISFTEGNFTNDGKVVANISELFKLRDGACSTLNAEEIVELLNSKTRE
jgi:hypothetical protein